MKKSKARAAAEEIAEIIVFWALKYNQHLKVDALADAYEEIIAKHLGAQTKEKE